MFSPRVELALRCCADAHSGQVRKGPSGGPYALHPIHMALILARLGESDTVLIAALLHDVVEDCPGWDLPRVEQLFDAQIAAVVGELTEEKGRSWQERKAWQVERIPTLSETALRVKAADKLHNLCSLVADLLNHPAESVWSRFNGGRDRTLEMSRQLVDAICARLDGPLAAALQDSMRRLEQLNSR
jgi:(p)ppGpp synthase/HD superfamily hydrolase